MNKTTEALMLAEEALGELRYQLGDTVTDNAITKYFKALAAICEALAEPDIEEMTLTQIASRHEPVQEPVAWWFQPPNKNVRPMFDTQQHGGKWKPLYAAPARTKDLTDDEIEWLVVDTLETWNSKDTMKDFARAVIQEYRRKNGIV